VNVEVFVKDETVWLTQKTMGQFFGVESHTITCHQKRGDLKKGGVPFCLIPLKLK
jgi:hypothetical protein